MRPLTRPCHSRRVLITGGAGFIGYHIASRLAQRGDDVTIADDVARGRVDRDLGRLLARPNVRIVRGDLTEARAWESVGTCYDEVYHLAAIAGVGSVLRRPYAVLRVNGGITLRLLAWMAAGGGRRLLFASTGDVYAWTRRLAPVLVPTPEDVPLALTEMANPHTAYAASKIFGELLVTHGSAAAHLPAVTVRLHDVYGPRMGHDHIVPQLWARARGGERPLVVHSPEHRRAFCYVDDAVRACVMAMRTPAAQGQTINVGNDREEVTISELTRRVLRAADIDAPMVAAPAASDPVERRCPDISRARALLGYEPRVPLDEGLRRTVAWYAAATATVGRAARIAGTPPSAALTARSDPGRLEVLP